MSFKCYIHNHIKNPNNQARKSTKGILNVQSYYLKKYPLIASKNFTLKKKIAENKNNPKELWQTLKFFF